ncbi:uncharacterized protein PG986_001576 [Apiospora aurea]|uniref:Uncharacterized protein n=1 Tax=Apiospora aurea TaxID=335848 RepID=A0ABR1QXC4_9PEZI
MAIQADLGPPVLPPLPLQPPLKPPSLASRNNKQSVNSNNSSTVSSFSQSRRQQQQQQEQHNHRNNHHRQHVYQQRHPAVYSPYPSLVSPGNQRPPATTTQWGKHPSIPATPSTPPDTGGSRTLINTSPRKDSPLPRIPTTTTPTKTSRHPSQQSSHRSVGTSAAPTTPTTPTAAAAATAARSRTPRPPPPAHRRIRYHQHHASRASARSELTSLTSGPLNNSLLQMTSQTPILTWPQKCVLAMSKQRYLASEPSIARQVFRSYYENRDDADDWIEEVEPPAAVSGLPSPPPEQDDYHFDFRVHKSENTASASAGHEQHHYRETGFRNDDAGEVSSLSSEERSPNMMDIPHTSNNGGEISSYSSSDNPPPKPLAISKNTATTEQCLPPPPPQKKPVMPRPPLTSTLISRLAVGAAVFRIDVRSQRPTILLLKKRATPAAAPATMGPASGLPSPYQPHHPQHHYNRSFREQPTRHLLSADRNDDDRTTRSSTQPPHPVWELPSGRVDDGDYCISDAIARCVKRLTSLNVVRISSMLRETTTMDAAGNEPRRPDRQNVDYDPLRALPRGATFASAGGCLGSDIAGASVRFMEEEGWPDLTPPRKEKMQLQLNWTVLVANVEDVVLQGVEHEEFVWANWNLLDMLNLTSTTREVAKEALEWAGRCSF